MRDPHRRAKTPRALPKRDSGIDGTMRRPVAALEARRSRSPNVADQVAVTEGRQKRGAQFLIGYPSEESCAGSHLPCFCADTRPRLA
jgi:hypothetical protein